MFVPRSEIERINKQTAELSVGGLRKGARLG